MKTVLRKKTFYITPEIDKMLKIAAAEDDLNFSQVVELALKEYSGEEEEGKKMIGVVTAIPDKSL